MMRAYDDDDDVVVVVDFRGFIRIFLKILQFETSFVDFIFLYNHQC